MTYTATYVRDGSGWFVEIKSIPGCHSQGRTLATARDRIREALSLYVESDEVTIVDDIRLPSAVSRALRQVERARARLVREQEATKAAVRASAQALNAIMGLRDAAEFLDLTPQRVQQVLVAEQ